MAGLVPAAEKKNRTETNMLTGIFHAIIVVGAAIAGLAIFLWAALDIIEFIRSIFPNRCDRDNR